MSSEATNKVLHPKTYGQYWAKPGMTGENWRHDWVSCGGTSDGGYVNDAPTGSSTLEIVNAGKHKRQHIATCIQRKGYEYGPGPY